MIMDSQDGMNNNPLPTPLSKKDDDNPYYLPTTQDGRTIYSCEFLAVYINFNVIFSFTYCFA